MSRKTAPSTENAFLQAILDNPSDDMVRLVFADWLEERGDPRGTFIRLQCQRAGMTRHDPNWKETLAQESALLRQYETEWSKPVLRLVDGVEFHRGFIEHVWASATKFLKNANLLFRRTPIRSVKLTLLGAMIQQLGECPQMAKVQVLNLSHNDGLTRRRLQNLVQSPHLGQLTTLRLFSCGVQPDQVEMLANTPSLARLQSLELGENMFGLPGLQSLAASPCLVQLRELGLRHVGPGILVSPLAKAQFRLTHLNLADNHIDNEGVTCIASSSAFSSLRHLVLDNTNITNLGVEALARSPHLTALEYLDLHRNRINDRGLQALAESTTLSQLVYLNLDRNEFGKTGALAMSKSGNFPKMRELALGQRWKDLK